MHSAGGVHAMFNAGNAGEALDPVRRKSMSAHGSNQAAGQQPLSDWLLSQELASKGHSRLVQPPSRLATCPAAKEHQPDSADGKRRAWHPGPPGSSDRRESQVTADEGAKSRPGGSSDKGTSQAPPPNVATLTPFSAFAQHNQQMHSRSSSGSAESDNPEGASAERKASGLLARKRSGSFGGRGVALGFMMEAQQQWRQDSFTQAAERRRDEHGSKAGRNGQSSLLSNSEQPAVQQQHLETGAPPGASNLPSLANNKATGHKLRSTQQQPSTATTRLEAHSTAGPRGLGLPGTAGVNPQSQSAAGPGRVEQHVPAGTAQQAVKASGNTGASQHQLAQSDFEAPTSAAMLNPFLAAAQQWHETSSDDSTDQLQHSNDGAAALPEQPSRPNPFATAADSAAIAEQWLAARQELLEQSDQWHTSGTNQGGASARSTTADLQSDRDQSSSHTAQQDSTHQESERRDACVGPVSESSQGPKRTRSVKAGPPPEKGSFQKSPPAIYPSGMQHAVPPPD